MEKTPVKRNALGLRSRLALSTALATAVFGVYGGRAAFAGDCSGGFGVYACSVGASAGTDETQTLANLALTVTTNPGFGIDTSTSGGDAFNLRSFYGLNFTDNNTAAITGAESGIFATHYATEFNTGALSITTTGQVNGVAADGINAFNDIDTTSLTISAAGVHGGNDGINAENRGDGALSITATGPVTAGDDGVQARNHYAGTDLTISVSTVDAGDDGINAENHGYGAMSITATGQVTSGDEGIEAFNSYFGTSLTVSVAGVSAAEYGIYAINVGSESLSITATGSVTGGVDYDGIYAINSPYGTELTVTAAAVSGGYYGIFAQNYGSGELSITATGEVTGTDGDGIFASNSIYGYGTDVTVKAAKVTGGAYGIYAENYGSGAVIVTATGDVTGGTGDGLLAYNSANGTDLTVTAAKVTGGYSGIHAESYGDGTLSVTVSGAVKGGVGEGIRTITGAGGTSNITLNDGASVSAASGIAISNDAGDSTTTVYTGASVTGEIRLADGNDDLTFDGGDFSPVTVFDGGDDSSSADGFVDKLTFRNVSGTVAGASVVNWENVVVDGNGVISFSDNALTTEKLDVINDGTVSMINGTAETFDLTGDLSLADGGAFALDIFSESNFDSISVLGEADFTLGGEFDFLFDIDPGDLFDGFQVTFLTAEDLIGFNELVFNFSGLNPDFSATVGFDDVNSELFLTLNRNGNTDPVPGPGMLGLLGAGLFGLFGLARRRKQAIAA